MGPPTAQGTVAGTDARAVDAADEAGVARLSVLLDDGTRLPVAAGALRAGGLRRVRPGQRVRVRVRDAAGGPEVVAATLPTTPWPASDGDRADA